MGCTCSARHNGDGYWEHYSIPVLQSSIRYLHGTLHRSSQYHTPLQSPHIPAGPGSRVQRPAGHPGEVVLECERHSAARTAIRRAVLRCGPLHVRRYMRMEPLSVRGFRRRYFSRITTHTWVTPRPAATRQGRPVLAVGTGIDTSRRARGRRYPLRCFSPYLRCGM